MSDTFLTRFVRAGSLGAFLVIALTWTTPAASGALVSSPSATRLATGDVFVMLQTDPNGAAGSFSFTHNFAPNGSFSLMDGRLQIFNSAAAGSYTVTVALQTGWQVVPTGDGYDSGCWDDQDNSTIDVNTGVATINLSAGEFVVCTFVLRKYSVEPPTANVALLTDPRGLGYWKNWSGCPEVGGYNVVGSREAALARRALRRGSSLLPIGTVSALTCAEATRLLSRNDLDGAKRANDAAYNLVSQLIAAKFNRAAGVAVPSCVEDAIASADQLLGSVNFSGRGTYLGPGSGGSTRTTALQLGGLLGRYNGGDSDVLANNCG